MANNTYLENYTVINAFDYKHYSILFVVWPFIAFLVALFNFSKKEAKTIIYIFIIYFGLTFVNNNTAVDSYRYALGLKATALLPTSDFFKIVGGLYSDTSVDIFEPLMAFLISRVTSYEGVYFAFWAAIFGFFYVKSMGLIFKRIKYNHGWNTVILMTFFVMIIPVTMISGIRMWTAAWMFFYGTYRAITEKQIRFLFIALAASIVHWSFITANIILFIYYFAGNRNMIYIPLALSSFIVPQLASPLFAKLALRAGGGFQQRYSGYASEGYISAVQEGAAQSAWFMRIANDLVFYYLIVAIIIIQVKYKSFMKGKEEKALFSFLTLFLAFVNFGMPIPSFGGRFMLVFFLFATTYLLLFFARLPRERLSLLVILGAFPMLLYSLVNFRIGSEHISAWILTPGFGAPLLAPVLSLTEVLFQ